MPRGIGTILPDGYYVEGWLLTPFALGQPIQVLRVNRNGTWRLGLFVSSPVVAIGDEIICTENSQYECVVAEPSASANEQMGATAAQGLGWSDKLN